MHPERFDALIARLERQARDHPAAYRWRVGIVALAGFAYLWFLGLGSIALIITLVLVVPASLWFALKFLWPLLLLPFAALFLLLLLVKPVVSYANSEKVLRAGKSEVCSKCGAGQVHAE